MLIKDEAYGYDYRVQVVDYDKDLFCILVRKKGDTRWERARYLDSGRYVHSFHSPIKAYHFIIDNHQNLV